MLTEVEECLHLKNVGYYSRFDRIKSVLNSSSYITRNITFLIEVRLIASLLEIFPIFDQHQLIKYIELVRHEMTMYIIDWTNQRDRSNHRPIDVPIVSLNKARSITHLLLILFKTYSFKGRIYFIKARIYNIIKATITPTP